MSKEEKESKQEPKTQNDDEDIKKLKAKIQATPKVRELLEASVSHQLKAKNSNL